jgi:hypothetical protein
MNSNSTVAEVALRREKSGLGNMIKALAWEECRVAGIIAGWCVIVGVLCLAFTWTQLGDAAWNHNREIVLLFVAGAPMLTALLLILSTDYSGHLVGGFSERILHLPVPVSAAVAVALAARTAFVFIAAFVFTAVCNGLFHEGPGFGAVLGIATFYLVAQTLDWLRKPVAGLSSLLLLVVIFAALYALGQSKAVADQMQQATGYPLAVALGLALVPSYALGVAAVHAARVGKRIGIPEIWEWPRYLSTPLPGRSKPFATVLSAQVWFDLRRTWWVLPGVMALGCVTGMVMGFVLGKAPVELSNWIRLMVSAGVLVFVILGAIMHGGLSSLIRRTAKPLPQFLYPLTSAQFAFARIVTSAVILVPMIVAALILHFAVAGEYFLRNIIPDALAIGATSYREVLWVLISRGLLVGLIAWPLMNGANRVIVSLFTAEVFLAMGLYSGPLDWEHVRILLPVVAIAVAVGVYARAWLTGVVSVRSVLVAAGVWALATWVLYHAVHTTMPLSGSLNAWYAESLITCLGWAAFIPLPFAAVALDVRRRRHSAAAPQDPSQHVNVRATLFTGSSRTIAHVAITFVVLTFVWLGWPMRPAYESYWRAQGYPVTLEELDAWYESVPDEMNLALAYLEAYGKTEALAEDFWSRHRSQFAAANPDADVIDHVLVVGNGEYIRGTPLDPQTWNETQTYWHEVTSQVAPKLKRLAADTSMGSRYPVDLRNGFSADLPHLAKMRALARELYVDSLHWTLAGEPQEAVDSIAATIRLANSVSEEPLLISQLVRLAVLQFGDGATQVIMNQSVLAEDALVRFDRILANAIPAAEDEMMLDRSMVGEATIALNYLASPDLLAGISPDDWGGHGSLSKSTVLFWQLAGPADGERMTMLRYYHQALTATENRLSGYTTRRSIDEDWYGKDTALFTPLAAITFGSLSATYISEWRVRTQFDIARTAIAVERYRLANGQLPETLQQLVPAYLPEVSMDYFANFEAPLGYRQLGNESYVVYSIGMDLEDDQGVEMDDWWSEGDITFTVAPLSVRTGPQVAAE